ncbi:MAG: hypothetical protein AAF494_00710 [Pseudomonadota bacterium]
MQSLGLTGLLKIELPARTIALCDGGFFIWNGDTYRSRNDLFGVIASIESLAEGIGDEIPALELELHPPGTAAVAELSQPGYQQSRARFWVAEYSPVTGLIIGSPDLMFEGQIDQTTLRLIRSERTLSTSVVSTAERLFERNLGNTLSPGFHKSIWPGETGHDNATGLKVPIAWGAQGPQQSFTPRGGGGGSGPGGRGGTYINFD